MVLFCPLLPLFILIEVLISLEEKKLALFLLLEASKLKHFVRCSGIGRADARGFATLIR